MIFNLGGPTDTAPTVTFSGSGKFTDEGDAKWNFVANSSGIFKTDIDCVVDIFVCGGGGAGGSTRGGSNAVGGGGGGGGYRATKKSVAITCGTSYTVTVGAGGTAVSKGDGNTGGQSNFKNGSTSIISADGGNGGKATWLAKRGEGGTGGSAGGDGRQIIDGSGLNPSAGADGAYAFGESGWAYPAAGRKFGAGGGGGGCNYNTQNKAGGAGGASGGGAGANAAQAGTAGTANMGGGGAGGSGIVIIRSAR